MKNKTDITDDYYAFDYIFNVIINNLHSNYDVELLSDEFFIHLETYESSVKIVEKLMAKYK